METENLGLYPATGLVITSDNNITPLKTPHNKQH
jgi:hypothetical protein